MSVSSTLIARSNESLFSFFDFLVFARCFPASFSSFFDVCQTADSLSHYSNCYLSMIRNNISFSFLLIMGNDLDIASFWFFLSVRKTLKNIGHFVEPVTAKCKPLAVYNSHRLSFNSHDRLNEPNLSLTLIKI